MTLSTLVGFEEYTDPQEFHDWINRELLWAPSARFDVYGPKGTEHGYWQNTIANQPSQGLDAWAITHHNNGEVIEWESHLVEGEEPHDVAEEPDLRVYTDFDTAYSYRDNRGFDCTDLHRYYITRIIDEYATPRDLTVWWQNEYTGEWHKDIEGLVDFR